jgi:hypothetical protein
LISPYKITLRGSNPFAQPVRLRWRGLEVRWDQDQAVVVFPDGEQVTVRGEIPQVAEQTRIPRLEAPG